MTLEFYDVHYNKKINWQKDFEYFHSQHEIVLLSFIPFYGVQHKKNIKEPPYNYENVYKFLLLSFFVPYNTSSTTYDIIELR